MAEKVINGQLEVSTEKEYRSTNVLLCRIVLNRVYPIVTLFMSDLARSAKKIPAVIHSYYFITCQYCGTENCFRTAMFPCSVTAFAA